MTIITYRWVCRLVGEHRLVVVWAPDEQAVCRELARRGLTAIQIIASDPGQGDADYPEAL